MDAHAAIEAVLDLLRAGGNARYDGEDVTQMEHALQCASLAATSGAEPALIVAALLHDLGHLLGGRPEDLAERGIDGRHEVAGARYLARWFPDAVTEPIRLHVEAKRYLCSADPTYLAQLSAASALSLRLQGGPLSPTAASEFMKHRYAADAISLRRWDEAAKVVGARPPPLETYRAAMLAVAAPRIQV